jgi:hypothetical protein
MFGWNEAIARVNDAFVPGRPDERPQRLDPDAAVSALPPRSKERLLQLRQRAADMRAAIENSMTDRDGAMEQVAELDKARRRLTAPFSREGHQMDPNSPTVQRAQAQLDAARERHRRAVAHIAKLDKQWAPLHNLVERLDRAVIGGGIKTAFVGTVPELIDPTTRKPMAATATVNHCRSKIERLRGELANVEKAPLPVAEALARARAQIAKLAASGAPTVSAAFERDDRFPGVQWAHDNVRLSLFGDAARLDAADQLRRLLGFAGGDLPNTIATLCWLFQDQMQERVADLIKESADQKKALSVQEQHKRRADLGAELLMVERQEVAAIERGEAQGIAIDIRPDANAAAVLHLMA